MSWRYWIILLDQGPALLMLLWGNSAGSNYESHRQPCRGIHHGKLTKHIVRQTMCTQLYQQGVDPSLITQLSGHKNPDGLAPYTLVSDSQQNVMCHPLQNPKSSHIAAIMPSHSVANNLDLPSTSSDAAGSGQPPAILGQHVDANQVTMAAVLAMPYMTSSRPGHQFMLNETRGLTGFLSNAVLNGPITMNIAPIARVPSLPCKICSPRKNYIHLQSWGWRVTGSVPGNWVGTGKLGQGSSLEQLAGSCVLLHAFIRHNMNERPIWGLCLKFAIENETKRGWIKFDVLVFLLLSVMYIEFHKISGIKAERHGGSVLRN